MVKLEKNITILAWPLIPFKESQIPYVILIQFEFVAGVHSHNKLF
jgi:hypothetical protein